MTQYFRKVRDPQRLLQRERSPLTGRRVPKSRSKRSHGGPARRFAGMSAPVAAAVGGLIAALLVTGVVVAVSSDRNSATATDSSTNPSVVPVASEGPALEPPAVTTAVVPSPVIPAVSIAPPVATTIVPAVTSIRLTSAAAATSAAVTSADPNGSASYLGSLPVFNIGVDCTADGCTFSLRAFAPGTVTPEGLTTIPAVAGRFTYTSTKSSPCTGNSGTQYSRTISDVLDFTLSGSQTVNGITVPQQIDGTLTLVRPEAGYVPHVGEVLQEGAEQGCAGTTTVFTASGDLVPTG